MKKCSKCNQIKNLDCYQKDSQKKDGLYSRCKECVSVFNKRKYKPYSEYSESKKKLKLEADARYRINNKEKEKKRHRKYFENNKSKYYDNVRKRKEKNPLLRLSLNIRSRMYNALKRVNEKKQTKTIDILGCNFYECKIHIENQFKEGMSWENYNLETWHIDHIIPLSSAKTEEDLYKLFHYTNLQPLWASENLSKFNKF
jgi:hypothetical protein